MIATPLDEALYMRLTGDATLMALIPGGVWNGSAPPETARAYLVLSNPTEEPGLQTFGRIGDLAVRQFDVFTPLLVEDPEPARDVMDRIEVLLRTTLSVSGHTDAITRREFREVLVEDDGTRHGVMRYRFMALETA